MQIKTTMKYYFISIRMAIIKNKKQKITRVFTEVDKLESLRITNGNVKWCSQLRKILWLFLKKIKQNYYIIQQFYLWINAQKKRKQDSSRYLHTSVHNCIIPNCQEVETTQMSMNRRMDKENVNMYINIDTHTHTHAMEYYSALKRNEVEICYTWMNFENIMLSEIAKYIRTNIV